ncbi:hypothetical protein JOQ06_013661 [Pogonophryne albipinna]|uniref:Uncharacterized protein n=1 Tax=Pogonophryne albipinna TaxID=1090488 RepID=A0AAD6FRI2_9TELE|nr:hypothetical protein JOQ06_013661 [Pogonophryne albipinna]
MADDVKADNVMQNRMAVVLCNLKPAKRRGLSPAAILSARLTRQVERTTVTVQGFTGDPDTELTPRQKVWEQIQAYLCTDGQAAPKSSRQTSHNML